jgi:hypothetical protein
MCGAWIVPRRAEIIPWLDIPTVGELVTVCDDAILINEIDSQLHLM